MEKPRILPGFMELLPEDQILFNEIVNTIKTSYESFGFLPIDTPVIEYSDVLLAKAGGETEKQIYRFKKGDNDISLRFDLTVPLARYVAQRYNDLIFPFKRYQIGKVYRGERAQRGRYREFYQYDIDVLAEDLSLSYDAEIPTVIYETFKNLNFGKFTIRINNRKLLNGLFKELNLKEKAVDILRVIDKIDKIGKDKIIELLKDLDLNEESISKIIDFITTVGSNDEIINKLKTIGIDNDEFTTGISELEFVIDSLNETIDKDCFVIDLTIARGLDYYTGTIYETILDDYKELGSICSGGRYDNLISNYSDKTVQGVGMSIGLTRLFFQLKEAGIISPKTKTIADILVIPFDESNIAYANKTAKTLRELGLKTDVYYENKQFKKKLNYANRQGIKYVAILGEEEEKANVITLKNMETGEQMTVNKDDIINTIK